MSRPLEPDPAAPRPDRRQLLRMGGAFAGGSLLGALDGGGLFGAGAPAGKAKRCIFLFMFGCPSQMDLFDRKPELQRLHGQTVVLERRRGEPRESRILGSARQFAQHGETGQWCSDALPRIAQHMDELAVIKSLYTDSFAHGSALLQMNTGQRLQGHPSIGAWLQHGLSSENPDLPGYVVMQDPRGGPISGPSNWSAGYMPAELQGTLLRNGASPLLDLFPSGLGSARAAMTPSMRARQLDLLRGLNELHAEAREGHGELRARNESYGLSSRLAAEAPEALDLSQESARTLEEYGVDLPPGDHPLSVGPGPFARQCLVARRLIERGVRFVQIYHGGGHQQQTWDAHHGVEENLSIHAPEIDQPVAALLTDLRRSGLLDETLVVWGGEFGRMPVAQLGGNFQQANPNGRDHNPKGFTMWLAGAGVRPGSYGETDDLGHEAAVDRHHVRDLHATILHLMGLDHERLTYRWGGLDRKLTGVEHAAPIAGVMA